VGARLSPDRNTSVDEDGVNDVDESNIQQSLSEKVERVLASDDPCAGNPRCIGRNACPSDKDFIGCGSCIADHNACRDYSGIIGTNSCVALDGPDKDSSPCLGNGWLGGTPLDGRIDNQSCHALMAWDMDYIRPGFAMPSGLTMMTVAAMRFARMSGRHPTSGPTRAWETGCEDMGPGGKTDRDSCWGVEACAGKIGSISCHSELTRYNRGDFVAHDGAKACADNTGSVGNQACQGDMSCHKNEGAISNESCLGNHACFENKGSVGTRSCIAKDSCNGNTGKIGKNACTLVGSCANNDKDIPDGCPSRDQLTKCENRGATCPCGVMATSLYPVVGEGREGGGGGGDGARSGVLPPTLANTMSASHGQSLEDNHILVEICVTLSLSRIAIQHTELPIRHGPRFRHLDEGWRTGSKLTWKGRTVCCEHMLAVSPKIQKRGLAVSFMNFLADQGFFNKTAHFRKGPVMKTCYSLTLLFPGVQKEDNERALAIVLLLRFTRNSSVRDSAIGGGELVPQSTH
ncbi:hypothetical protein THAOC_21241, partial [Thalassiosira oceanica]